MGTARIPRLRHALLRGPQLPDRLRDESAAAVFGRTAAVATFRKRSDQIDAALLSPQERVSLRMLQFRLDAALAINKVHGSLPFGVFDPWAPVTQMGGLHLDLPQLAKAARFRSVADYEAWLKRLDAVPGSVSQLIERMQIAMAAGWMPPKVAISGVPAQLEAQLVDDVQKSPRVPAVQVLSEGHVARRAIAARACRRARHSRQGDPGIPFVEELLRDALSRRSGAATGAVESARRAGVLPSLAGLEHDHSHDAPRDPRSRPGRGGTHRRANGCRRRDQRVQGHPCAVPEFLTTDPQFFFTKPEDMLVAYRDIAKRADAALPGLFVELPRQTYGIRAMPPEEGNNAERYMPGSQDGGRPGWFEANVNDLKTRTKWTMETLLLHEAVPGHHLQGARAQELKQLPTFRRYSWFTAYGEGWALYAESLGDEMGFYEDPNQKFGNLSFEMLRACRLVVDTGLHAFGWSREHAIDYMVANSGLTRADVTAEVDRYLVWPGQATAYKIGELKIKELRAKAKAKLGERFDLRRFHNAVIDNGALPLSVLEQSIDEWIAGEMARAPAK